MELEPVIERPHVCLTRNKRYPGAVSCTSNACSEHGITSRPRHLSALPDAVLKSSFPFHFFVSFASDLLIIPSIVVASAASPLYPDRRFDGATLLWLQQDTD